MYSVIFRDKLHQFFHLKSSIHSERHSVFIYNTSEKTGQLIVRLIHESSLIVRVQFVLVYIELVC